jgi:hypothetical protein
MMLTVNLRPKDHMSHVSKNHYVIKIPKFPLFKIGYFATASLALFDALQIADIHKSAWQIVVVSLCFILMFKGDK